jgi:adenylate kinase
MPGANPDLPRLFHQLNNQLGVILANAELLERRLSDEHRARAEQVVSGTLEAIETARRIRLAMSVE